MDREILSRGKRVENGEKIAGTELTLIRYITPRRCLFLCDCGNYTEQDLCNIEKGKVKSCGCKRYRDLSDRNRTHGESNTRLYHIWRGMKTRCQNSKHGDYVNYGARGISVYTGWDKSYKEFRDWALTHGYADNLTIERNDVNGNYCPSNCCWISGSEQAKNRRPRKQVCNRDEKGRFVKNT